MRNFVNAINEFPHTEERPWARLEARATAMQHLLVLDDRARNPPRRPGLKTPAGAFALLILTTFVAVSFLPLRSVSCIDEATWSRLAASLQLQLFRCTPIAWWLAWGMRI